MAGRTCSPIRRSEFGRKNAVRNSHTKPFLALASTICVLASAAHAAMTISNAKTKNMTCAGGVCTPTGGNPNLNVGELQTMLASSDVTVKSNAAAPDIGILNALTWASTHRLTLDAYESIHVRAPVVIEGTSGLTLITNDGGSGGDYNFNTTTSGAIAFWDIDSKLIINGASFTLVKDLATLAGDIATNPSGRYALAASYDASSKRHYPGPPIATPFFGAFEGLGNGLLNLTVIVTHGGNNAGAGLFLDNHGLIRDITLVSANISGSLYQSGALAAQNEGSIENASSLNGTVRNSQIAGGLVGSNSGQIASSWSDGSVLGSGAEAGSAVGGIAGQNSGTISFSNSAAVSTAYGWSGGIVGTNAGVLQFASASGQITGAFAGGVAVENTGSVSYCRSSGNVTATSPGRKSGYKTAGGLVGANLGSVTQSFATGNVLAFVNHDQNPPRAGGLVGLNQEGAISYSYATGSVKGRNAERGGLVGLNTNGGNGASAITQAYATGAVNTPDQTGGVGGLIGEDLTTPGSNALTFWDLDTSGISNPHQGAGNPLDDPGITGITDAQLKSALPTGFDPNVWGQSASINNGWPYLLANPPPP